MAARNGWKLAAGCLVLVGLAAVGIALMVAVASGPGTPHRAVLEIRIAGPIREVVPEDPLARLAGERAVGLRDLYRALTRAAEDERVVGLELRIDSVQAGMATVQELRGLVGRVRDAGKHTAAYLDTAGEFAPGNLEYLLASSCDEVSLDPMGDVNLVGLAVRSPFIRGTLDKLGIRPEFPGRGEYKTARFLYTQRDFTPEHREMMRWLLDSLMGQLVEGVASSRHLDPAAVRAAIERAPLDAEAARTAGLVDHLEDWTTFRERLDEGPWKGARRVRLSRYLRSLRRGSGPVIAVVTGTGAILRGESRHELNPLFGGDVMGAETLARAWRRVRERSGVKAAVFRIDSPGGSAIASEIIRREMARTAEKIPVVVSMANLAASGGYWITCGAQRIVAEPGTLTASIGVFAGHFNADRFWAEKLGVTFGRLDGAPNAAIYGDLEDWTPAQRRIVERMLDRIYDAFLERVASSRGMTKEQVDAVGRGRVFTGIQARERGLVDQLGGLDTAIRIAKELAHIPAERRVRLLELPAPRPWWQRMLERRAGEARLAEELERMWTTGRLEVPGVVWMPPPVIR